MEAKKPETTTRKNGNGNRSRTVKSIFTACVRKKALPSTTSSVNTSSAEAYVRQNVPKGATASAYNSSTCEINCDPCSAAGDDVLAVGCCSECKEYYCQSCYRTHSKIKATKDHTLIDQSTMHTISTTSVSTSVASMNIKQGSDADGTQFQDGYHFSRDINIKYPNEETDSFVTGMTAISDKELVIIDPDNKSVKMIDLDNDVMTSVMKLDKIPFSITAISNREVAITFPDEKLIRVLTTTGGLSVNRGFKLSGLCLAVQYHNDKLYVSYKQPVKFQILSLSGGVKKTIKPDSQFLEHCTLPRQITVHPDESKIYVSDWKNNVVLCMDMNGTMLAVYTDEELEKPCVITFTPFGSIFLCNRKQHIIYKMAEDLSEASVMLASQDGLYSPQAMCFCPGRKSLYISSGSDNPKFRNVIKQYKYI